MSQTWLEVAHNARNAARRLMTEDNLRSCVSRCYYAAYSKVTHELVATAGLTMPKDREGRITLAAEARFAELITTSMPNMQPAKRVKLSELIGRLYTLRISADYKPSVEVDGRDAREAVSIMNTVFESF